MWHETATEPVLSKTQLYLVFVRSRQNPTHVEVAGDPPQSQIGDMLQIKSQPLKPNNATLRNFTPEMRPTCPIS